MNNFKPLLAATATDITKLQYPVYTSPKLDGIRAVVLDGQILSRTLKPIPNRFISRMLSIPELNGFDGELVVGDTFNETTSAVMSEDGEPGFVFCVFDDFTVPSDPFSKRYSSIQRRVDSNVHASLLPYLTVVKSTLVGTPTELELQEQWALDRGYEGLMVRDPNGIYKFGRSTEKQGILLKLKRFEDIEAEVIGFIELFHNGNEQTTDALGHSVRSSHKANQIPGGTLGALICRNPLFDYQFEVGTGFTKAQRQEIWDNRPKYLGAFAKIKYQKHGSLDRPRLPVFLGFRSILDMGEI